MKIYAGFDCCGSHTRSMLVSESGAMLGCGEGSGCEVILSICSLGDILLCMMLFEYASVDADELKERLYRETENSL